MILFLKVDLLFSETIRSFYELSFANIEKQESEFSCGVSVIHSILRNLYNVEISQKDLESVVNFFSNSKKNGGISFFDIKTVLSLFDVIVDGFHITPTIDSIVVLRDAGNIPIICHLENEDDISIGHFIILYGIDNKYVYILDPKIGKRILSFNEFLDKWSGNFLQLNSPCKNGYNELFFSESKRSKYLDFFYEN